MSTQRATATEIWQKDGREYEGVCGFLWADVLEMKCARNRCFDEEGNKREWENRNPKTIIYLADLSCLVVLGKIDKWLGKWDNYLEASSQPTLLFSRN